MAKYIECEAIKKKLQQTAINPQTVFINTVLAGLLDNAPAADVVEVRRGCWMWDVETHGDPMYGLDEDFGYRCSECKVWADEWGVDGDIYEEPPIRLHYCPNCGAKMDGNGENNG